MMPEGPETATTPAIPAQRAPEHDAGPQPERPESGEATPAAAGVASGPGDEGVAGDSDSGAGDTSVPAGGSGVLSVDTADSGLGVAPAGSVALAGGSGVLSAGSGLGVAPAGSGDVAALAGGSSVAPAGGWDVAPGWLDGPHGTPAGYRPVFEGAARRRGRWVLLLIAAGAVGVLMLAGLLGLQPRADRDHAAIAAASAPVAASVPPVTPYDKAVAALAAQSAALLRGDEGGWLAAVDSSRSSLRTRYRSMFRSLRALGVSSFEYQPGLGQPVPGDATAVSFRVDAAYCFGPEMCPADPATAWQKPPHITQKLTLRPDATDAYVITEVGAAPEKDARQPVPWETGDLVFAQGARVTVAAAPEQAKNLRRVLAAADAAAAVDDHYATLIGTPQRKYRIYLAGEKQWKSWYGGDDDAWAIGLAIPLNMTGIDVLLRMKEMGDPLVLRVTLQHELGHVVTLTGAYRADAAEDTWLSEGIAEYIGWQPRRATGSLRRSSVRWLLNRNHPPTSMVPVQPGPDASDRAGDAFYGLSHFATDCMAHKYGEAKLFAFVRLVLAADNDYDQASRDAFGAPFATVDKACLTWIKQQVR